MGFYPALTAGAIVAPAVESVVRLLIDAVIFIVLFAAVTFGQFARLLRSELPPVWI
jgi:hypothetical protein